MNVSELINPGESIALEELPKPMKSLPKATIDQVTGMLIHVRLEGDGETPDLSGLRRTEVTMVWQGAGRQVRQPVIVERVRDRDIWLRLKEEQRREFMRVQARLGLWYHPLSEDDLEEVCERVLESAEPAGTMGAEADRLWGGNDLADLVNYHFTQMARFLSQLDAKLDYVVGRLQDKDIEAPILHDLETYDLSGGGLGFFEDQPLQEGSWVELRVQLSRLPYIDIHAVGRVARCVPMQEPDGKKRFYIGIEFDCIHDDSREAIFRFISGIERKMLRDRRDHLSN